MEDKNKKDEPKLEVNHTNDVINSDANTNPEGEGIRNKPSPEEIKEAQNDFEQAAGDFGGKLWPISDGNPQEVGAYLREFIEQHIFWTKNGWMGVIKFNDEVGQAIEKVEVGEHKELMLGYQALEFGFYSLSNPGGVGLETARKFEDENEQYTALMERMGNALEEARSDLQNIQFLQNRWAAMEQGFYMEREDGVEDPSTREEPKEEPKEEQE